ncbi:MAG: hypothetical protein K2X93_07335 [Candidatus Obscuribacterales bacterium]|nr:hypothetical protein [Candidatus Obscuribacterales bacterium]
MPKKVLELPKIADPTIEVVLGQYLKEAAASKKTGSSSREDAIDLFMSSMNGYGYQSLSADETRIFEYYFEQEDDRHKEFCQIFGADKIVENVSEFVGYFLIRKVMDSPTFLGKVAKEIEQLCYWLEKDKYASAEEAREGANCAAKAAKQLPRSAKASELLWTAAKEFDDVADPVEEGIMDITIVSSDSIWLCPIGGKEIGPIFLPKKITDLLEVGWDINCALAKHRGKWLIVEVGNIYPN